VLDFDILIEPDMAARCETTLLLSGEEDIVISGALLDLIVSYAL
jgi:hypothetical protein